MIIFVYHNTCIILLKMELLIYGLLILSRIKVLVSATSSKDQCIVCKL